MKRHLKNPWLVIGVALAGAFGLGALTTSVGVHFDPAGEWMQLRDGIELRVGTDSDAVLEWDGDSLDWESASAGTTFNIDGFDLAFAGSDIDLTGIDDMTATAATIGTITVGTALNPDADGGATFGASGTGWGNAYFNGTITATTGTATFGAVVLNTSLVPDTDGGATLGASGTGFGNTFINGNLTASTGTATFGAAIVNTSLVPDGDGGATFGASGNGWGNAFFDGTVTATGTVTVNTALVPDADGGATFGASGTGWGAAYFDSTITATSGTATFGAVVVNTSIVPDTDGGATFGASGTGWGNAYFNGTVITTGTLTIGNTDAIAGIRHGQITIANGATSGTVAMTDVDADDAVILCPNESLSTAVVYASIAAGSDIDAVLVDVHGGDATCNATQDYTISYIAILD